MMNKKYLFFTTFFILLIIIIFSTNTRKDLSLIVINIKDNVDRGNLAYDVDIAKFLAKNENMNIEMLNVTKNKDFVAFSLKYLKKIYKNNPNVKEFNPSDIFNNNKNIIVLNITIDGYEDEIRLLVNSQQCFFRYNYSNLNQTEMYYFGEIVIEDISTCLYQYVTKEKGNFIIIGTDHAMSVFTINIAKRIKPNSKIGLIVFDEHVDIYGLKDKYNIANKGNIFGKLLLEEYVDYIVFIGVSQDAKYMFEQTVDINFTRTDIFKKIEVYSDADLMVNGWGKILSHTISNMKKNGITNIIVSIDVDVLPIKYTGFEYSILAPSISLIRFGVNHTEVTLAEIPTGFSQGLEWHDINNYLKYIRAEAFKNSIQLGVVGNRTTLLGDIQELLTKQDINMDTTKVTKKVIDSLYKNLK